MAQPVPAIGKTRLEAFSDGVIAMRDRRIEGELAGGQS